MVGGASSGSRRNVLGAADVIEDGTSIAMQTFPLRLILLLTFGLAATGARANVDLATLPQAAAVSPSKEVQADAAAPAGVDGKPEPAAEPSHDAQGTTTPAPADVKEPPAPVPASVTRVVPTRAALRARVRAEALKAGLPGEIADAVAEVESSYDPAAIGAVGEIGLMQVLPSTARMLGFNGTNAELAQPDNNIRYGVTYLGGAWRLADKDICTAVMKYRAGHGETRFSHRSVAYCLRVRAILAANGYPVTGEVPKATFGDPAAATLAVGVKRVAGRRPKSRFNWAVADARMRTIASKITAASLTISR